MASKQASILTNVYANSLIWPFKTVFWVGVTLLISLGLSICTAMLLQAFWWKSPEVAMQHYQRTLKTLINASVNVWTPMDMVHKSSSDQAPTPDTGAAMLMVDASDWLYKAVWVHTSLEESLAQAKASKTDGLEGLANNLYREHIQSVETCILATKLFGARLVLLLSSVPLLLAAATVATVDGLVLRYIRKEGGGRESSFLYHRAKYLSVMLLGTTLTVLLLLPINVSPNIVIPWLALTFGVLVRTQWTYYKKYI